MLKRCSAAKRRRLSREENVCSSSTSMTVNKITADIINNDYTRDIKEFNACHRVSNICRDLMHVIVYQTYVEIHLCVAVTL